MKKIFSVKSIKIILIIFYLVGLAGILLPATAQAFFRLVPLAILFTTILLLLYHGRFKIREIIVFSLIFALGILVEWLGVNTGVVFGDYTYGKSMGPAIDGTPYLIGVNWLLVTYCAYAMVQKSRLPVLVKIISGASLLVLFDMALEPVAIYLGLWEWMGNEVPLKNYLSWFVVAFTFLVLMHMARIRLDNPIATFIYWIQFIFFVLVILGAYLVG